MANVRVLRPGDEAPLMRFLERHADSTMFLRGNLADAGLVDEGRPCEGTWVAAFEEEQVVGAAAIFWNGNLILEAPEALESVVQGVAAHAPRALRGIIGRLEQTRRAKACLGLVDAPTILDSREVLMALDLADLRVPEALAGGEVTCRRAGSQDVPLLVPWSVAYRVETLGEEPGPALTAQAEEGIGRQVVEQRVWMLEGGGRPLAMTAFNCRTQDGVQVGGVYTPPELRGRGHARAAVAGSLLDARREGTLRSILFTDEQNAPALACYRGLGFASVGDYAIVLLREPHPLSAGR